MLCTKIQQKVGVIDIFISLCGFENDDFCLFWQVYNFECLSYQFEILVMETRVNDRYSFIFVSSLNIIILT